MRALLFSLLALFAEPAYLDRVHSYLLPEDYKVFVRNSTVVNHPAPGYQEKVFPTANVFRGKPGCYLACYSRQGGVYSVGGGIFAAGQIRVEGRYVNRICRPRGFEEADVSAVESFKKLCNAKVPGCKDCWAGGDTGGWFGIQENGSVDSGDGSQDVQRELTR